MKTRWVYITPGLIRAGRSNPGGWTNEQIALLGVPTPRPANWRTSVCYDVIPRDDAEKFLSLRTPEPGKFDLDSIERHTTEPAELPVEFRPRRPVKLSSRQKFLQSQSR